MRSRRHRNTGIKHRTPRRPPDIINIKLPLRYKSPQDTSRKTKIAEQIRSQTKRCTAMVSASLQLGCAIGPEVFCVGGVGGRVYYWDGVGVVVAEVNDGLDLD